MIGFYKKIEIVGETYDCNPLGDIYCCNPLESNMRYLLTHERIIVRLNFYELISIQHL